MTALGTAAVGAVAFITGRLRRTDLQTGREGATLVPTIQLPTEAVTSAEQAVGILPPSPTALPGPTATRSGVCPPVMISRQEWGALEPNLKTSGERGAYHAVSNPDGWMIYDRPLAEILSAIIVHHSALPLDNGPREIQALHMYDKNFADVGYQYMIDEKGRLYEGRAMNVRGAHTYRYNYGTVGICLIGNFEEIQPSEAQVNMLRELIHCLIAQYPGIGRIAGHRDYNPNTTLCPGNHLARLLPGLAEEQILQYGA